MNVEELLSKYTTPAVLAETEPAEPYEAFEEYPPTRLTRTTWGDQGDFDAFIESLDLRHFKPHEFLVKGSSHHSGGCAGLNTNPPRALWANIVNTARMLDELRERLGATIRLTSVYRSPDYNRCLTGTAPHSFHMTFNASDFVAGSGSPSDWATELRRMRSQGLFRGGIGTYTSFVHVDTRGSNADW